MNNPFETIEARLSNIENLLLDIKHPTKDPEPLQDRIEEPISQNEAARFLGKSRQTLTAWRKKGIIKAHRLSGRIYFLKSELLEAMK